MTTVILIGLFLTVLYGGVKMLIADAYDRGRREEVLRRADLQAKLKAHQTNVVMAPKTVDDTISDLNNGAF
ncbi:MAG: hypothetical protein EBS82_06240 [Methylocystaceae bacterium]|nr:hypothetical protein [Methylocystaceae bacterium]